MEKIFVGVDRRQWLAFTVLQYSIYSRSSLPVQVIPLLIQQLPITRVGLTDFTFSRYLVPWLCGYKGRALFVDADFLCLSDISEIFTLFDPKYSVQVVQCSQRFEWTSLMLFNCEKSTRLTPEYINNPAHQPQELHWGQVGQLPDEWNFLVGYDLVKEMPKMVHYTQGIPGFIEMQGTPFFEHWHQDLAAATATCSWIELMGKSVHAKSVVARIEMQSQLKRKGSMS